MEKPSNSKRIFIRMPNFADEKIIFFFRSIIVDPNLLVNFQLQKIWNIFQDCLIISLIYLIHMKHHGKEHG